MTIGARDALRIEAADEATRILRKVPVVWGIVSTTVVAFFVLRVLVRHWKLTLPVVATLYLRIRWGSWWLAGAGVALPPLLALVGLVVLERRRAAPGVSGAPPSLVETSIILWRCDRLRRRWPRVAASCGLRGTTSGAGLPLQRLRPTPTGASGLVRVTDGRTEDDVTIACSAIASMLRCHDVEAAPVSPGTMRLTFGFGAALIAPFGFAELARSEPGWITYGRHADEVPATISVETSVLIGGKTGSGKSGCVWAILAGLLAAEVPTRLWVLDPAGGVEFDALRSRVGQNTGTLQVVAYEDRVDGAVGLIQRFHDAMVERHEEVREAGARKFVPNEATPLNLLLIDELIPLQAILRKGADSPFGIVLSQGRKAGFLVVAATQAAQVDVLGRARDLFPQRLCFATVSPEATGVILGHSAGIAAHRIALPSMAGVGFAYSDEWGGVRRFRTAFVTDRETALIARGEAIGESTGLYRWFDAAGVLLYVGISNDVVRRANEHSTKPWWPQVASSTVEWYPSRPAALTAEKAAIESELPAWNVLHNGRRSTAIRPRRPEPSYPRRS